MIVTSLSVVYLLIYLLTHLLTYLYLKIVVRVEIINVSGPVLIFTSGHKVYRFVYTLVRLFEFI